MTQEDFQLRWPAAEINRISSRIETDYRNALADHNRRMARWREYYRRWRCSVDPPAAGEETASNVPVPFIRWNILTKLAKEIDSLFGDDAEVVAVPVGPSDAKRDAKVGKYMTWRVLNSMKLIKPICVFTLRKLIFGRSIAYSPWKRDTFEVLNPAKDYKPEEVVDYEGPDFKPQWPDDIIVPCEDAESIHDFSFVIRKYRATPDQLLTGEEEGRYQNIKDNWRRIVELAQKTPQRETEGDEIKRESDEAEGLFYERPLSAGEGVLILEWYGRWRPLKGKTDGGEFNLKRREAKQKDFVVRLLWDLRLIVGIQDLQYLYPTVKNRRPFVESAMLSDGSYWPAGLAEMLLDLEDELRVNHNQATDAGQLAATPMYGYRPGAGANPETFEVEPGIFIPLDNPQEDVAEIKTSFDLAIPTWKEQCVLAYGEKVTGHGDLQMGRQVDRPNAPRTAAQTQMLLEEGNVRISLDTKILADDMSGVLCHFWGLEYMFSPEETFFRVTEEDADGLFAVNNGGSMLTMEDRDGRYDFRLQFANSVWSREAKKQQTLARYQLDLQNPLIAQNPQALWEVTRDAHEALGDPNFEDTVPRPPAPDMSIDPRVEWVNLLHGEDVHVNPLDNDLLHMTRHMKDLQTAEKDPGSDRDAMKKLVVHYHDHIMQLQQKRIQQAVIEQAVQAAGQLAAGGKMPAFANGLFGGPPNLPQNPQGVGPFPFSGHSEVMHEQ